jgi:hypothetical protein
LPPIALELVPVQVGYSGVAAEPFAPTELDLVLEPAQCLGIAGDSEVGIMVSKLSSESPAGC